MLGIERHQGKDYAEFEEHHMLMLSTQGVEPGSNCKVVIADLPVACLRGVSRYSIGRPVELFRSILVHWLVQSTHGQQREAQ